MAKKRRKLDKNFEKIIYSSKKKIELILAKIYDITDDDIQKEYMSAFQEVVNLFDLVKNDYELVGFHEDSQALNKNFEDAISKFEAEYEI
tara:strand:- start:889 stop:1158 length:270 start_codon:yes stop_codon:yes gene_type:complete